MVNCMLCVFYNNKNKWGEKRNKFISGVSSVSLVQWNIQYLHKSKKKEITRKEDLRWS